jgi:UDP:flavonoid glycosyltransferase YjiC (YdhE family)
MRILFTFVGGTGHFNPLVGIARAAGAAGYTVAFACRGSMIPAVAAAGLVAHPTSPADSTPRPRLELQAPDAAREDEVIRHGFADRTARDRAAAIRSLASDWQPDLIVCDEMDFGAMLAAERLGLPYASVLVIAAGAFVRPELIADPLAALRAELGLPPDPELAMLSRYLVFAPFPPSYRDPADPLPPTAHALRPFGLDPDEAGALPPSIRLRDDRPAVYLTLGTEFNVESGDLMARLIAGLRELRVNLVATVGEDIDPAEFGPQPENVMIERYVPQAVLLPHCRLVVSHGGSGTVIGALAHGLPQVMLPMGADQLRNAARCAALGVAQVLDVMTVTPASVRAVAAHVLADPTYRRHAERIKDEIVALPGADHAVTLLARLAAERRPLLPE